MTANLTRVDLIKNIGDTDLLFVTFSDGVQSHVFGSYTDTLNLLNKEVCYSLRDEIIDGKMTTAVNELTEITRIVTLDRENNFKLFCDMQPTCDSNVIFADYPDDGTTIPDAKVFVINMKYDSSERANWCKFTIMDKHRKTATLRVFDPEQKYVNLSNKYIMASIKRSKYGFSATDCYLLDIKPAELNPEIKLAETFITNILASDEQLWEVITRVGLINKMKEYTPEDGMETGYDVVRCAIELALARDFINLTKSLNIQLLMRLIIYSRFFLLFDKIPLSQTALTLLGLNNTNCPNKLTALKALDPEAPKKTAEGEALKKVKDLAKFITSLTTIANFLG